MRKPPNTKLFEVKIGGVIQVMDRDAKHAETAVKALLQAMADGKWELVRYAMKGCAVRPCLFALKVTHVDPPHAEFRAPERIHYPDE